MDSSSVPSFGEAVLARFAAKNPMAASMRFTLEQLFSASALDAVFERARDRQYARSLAFSTVVDVMGAVVTGRSASVHVELQKRAASLTVSAAAFYDKLKGSEPAVASALVEDTAAKACALVTELGGLRAPLLEGFPVRIVDGNHLASTERRLLPLSQVAAGPLPGLALVVFDPAPMLMMHVVLCEDGHAQERSLTGELLKLVKPGECWLGDRNFCTRELLFGIMDAQAMPLLRQHASLPGVLVGERVACGRTERGAVFEQGFEVTFREQTRRFRRITIELDEPTRDKETELHVLTTLPTTVPATVIATLYLARWTLETAFGHLASWLDAELKPLGYPRAALLGFCVGITAYNAISTLLGALRAVHGEKKVAEEVSGYYVAQFGREAVGVIDDLVEPEAWEQWRALPLPQAAQLLKRLVARIDLRTLRKHTRGPKTPVPPRTRFKGKPHVSTKKLLDQDAARRR